MRLPLPSLIPSLLTVATTTLAAGYTLPAGYHWSSAKNAGLKVAIPPGYDYTVAASGDSVAFSSKQVPQSGVGGSLRATPKIAADQFDKFVTTLVKTYLPSHTPSGPPTKIVRNGLDCTQVKGTGSGSNWPTKTEYTVIYCVGTKSTGALLVVGPSSDPAYAPITESLSAL